jgi:hypothetical protein
MTVIIFIKGIFYLRDGSGSACQIVKGQEWFVGEIKLTLTPICIALNFERVKFDIKTLFYLVDKAKTSFKVP